MRRYYLISIIFLSLTSQIFAQGPGEPFNPMTANGAKGISRYHHILFWNNPPGVKYNQVYFSQDSNLVINMNSSAKIYDGFPSTVFSSASLDTIGPIDYYKLYYWKIVEYDSTGVSSGTVWFFRTQYHPSIPFSDDFSNGLNNWEKAGPFGLDNWIISQTDFAGGTLPELVFSWAPTFIGDSYLMYNQEIAGHYSILFKHYLIWVSNPCTVGLAITTNGGITWDPFWEINPTGNVGPTTEFVVVHNNYDFRIAFYYSGNSSNINSWYIDDVEAYGYLTPPWPPNLLQAVADTSDIGVHLSWAGGSCPDPLTGYDILRKDGLPMDTASYSFLAVVDENTFSFTDTTVFKNNIYSYKIRTLCGPPGGGSIWGNEATAYVPDIITSVKTKNIIPTEFALEQNYPNPFNNSTIIKYSIPQEGLVTLKVYNLLGEEVARPVNDIKQTGNYEVSFDATGLPSGIYFYRLNAGDFIETKKMILLK